MIHFSICICHKFYSPVVAQFFVPTLGDSTTVERNPDGSLLFVALPTFYGRMRVFKWAILRPEKATVNSPKSQLADCDN